MCWGDTVGFNNFAWRSLITIQFSTSATTTSSNVYTVRSKTHIDRSCLITLLCAACRLPARFLQK